MGLTLCGLLVLAAAPTYPLLVAGAALVGLGSAVFHPESSRVARLASGGRYGLAQSVFQVGGNVGSSIGPLLAALIVVPYGQSSIAWFSVAALPPKRTAREPPGPIPTLADLRRIICWVWVHCEACRHDAPHRLAGVPWRASGETFSALAANAGWPGGAIDRTR